MQEEIISSPIGLDSRHILDPYRTLGCFVSGKIRLSETQPFSLAIPTNNSYKIYSQTLAIKVVSPPLENIVESVLSYNEYSFIKAGNKIIKMKYHHIVKEWTIEKQSIKSANAILMKFQGIILISEGNRIYVIDEKADSSSDLDYYQTKSVIVGMIHPITYINKVLVFNSSSLTLINPLSQKTLYQYPILSKYLTQTSTTIVTIQSSKLVNIIAVALSNGEILIFNLKKDQIVFKVKLKLQAICIAFSDQQALMATSDAQGNVVLWDMDKKKILYKFQEFISGPIDSLVFIPGTPILTCSSTNQNCIKQLRINLQDNRILTLYRERVGITQPIQKINLLNNNELTLSSKSQTMFTSLYSHTNNYKLNRALDSSHPYHLISKHFSVQIFKDQTMQKSHNIHESALIGKISLSQKYFIVATRTRLIKLGANQLQAKITGIVNIALFNQHFVYVFTPSKLIILDFSTFLEVKSLPLTNCSTISTNHFGNLLSFYNKQTHSIQVYDMEKIQLAREYFLDLQTKQPMAICFTTDNKYMLSSHVDTKLNIWSIVHNNLFKAYILQNSIVTMSFTQDNQFFLSTFQHQREVNIWNNYIGKLLSNRQKQINHCEEDFRTELKRRQKSEIQHQDFEVQTLDNAADDILDSIPNSVDNIPQYKFDFTQKWLPLIFYDEIKQRNTLENAKQLNLPFFLDFKNIDQEKKKIQKQVKQQLLIKKKQKQQKIDKNLQNTSHEISLSQQSKDKDFIACINTLQSLSIAQIDYQLRKFLLNPMNKQVILKMFGVVLKNNKGVCQQFVNILFHRSLYLIQSQIFDSQLKQILTSLLKSYKQSFSLQKIKIDRCISIAQKMM